jgi:hypothetical protein
MILPYSKGPFITNPLIHYLREMEIYDSHGSGIEDFGILLKPYHCIQVGSVIRISVIDFTKFQISYIANLQPTEKMMEDFCETDFDWNFFSEFETKSFYLTMDFNVREIVQHTLKIEELSYRIGIDQTSTDEEEEECSEICITKEQLMDHVYKNKDKIYYITKINSDIKKHDICLYSYDFSDMFAVDYIGNYTSLPDLYGMSPLDDFDIEIIKMFNKN